jgi:hypothetical protein
MVGATTPELVILISNLPQRENCKLPGLCANFSHHCMSTDGKADPIQQYYIQGAALVNLVIFCVMMERVYTYNAVNKGKN